MLAGAVLLRLRRRLPDAGPALGKTAEERKQLLIDRRPDHQDHDRPALPAGGRQGRRRPHVFPTRPGDRRRWRWSSPAPATSRRSRSHGRWAANKARGRDVPQLRRAHRSTATPTASRPVDVQGVRARQRARAGHAARHDVQRRRRRTIIPQNDFADCDGPYPATATSGTPATRRRSGTFDMYTRHPAVGEHLLRPARADDRAVRALRSSPRTMGVDLTDPRRRERVPVVHPRRRRRQPAGDGRGLRDLRRARQALRRPAGHRDPDRSGKVLKDYPEQCTQVMQQRDADAVNDILAGVIEPGGFGAGIAIDQAGRRQDRHHPDSNRRSGSSATRPTWPTAAMIAGANQEGHAITLIGQTVGGAYIYDGVRVRRSPARCGARRCARSRSSCPTTTSSRRPDRVERAGRSPSDRGGMSIATPTASRGRRLHGVVGPRSTPASRGHGRRDLSRRRRRRRLRRRTGRRSTSANGRADGDRRQRRWRTAAATAAATAAVATATATAAATAAAAGRGYG